MTQQQYIRWILEVCDQEYNGNLTKLKNVMVIFSLY